MNFILSDAGSSGEDDPLLNDLLDEAAARAQAGEAVDVDAYARAHPRYADQLRALLPAVLAMARLGPAADAGQMSFPPADAGAVPEALGDFRVVREIGRGGMGIVYEAEQLSLGRRVALKVLPFAATMDPRHLQRFKNEARAAASLRHPHIVPVYWVGSDRGVHYYAMQLIEGWSLSTTIESMRRAAGSVEPDGRPATAATQTPSGAASPTAPEALLSTLPSFGGAAYFEAVARLAVQAAEALEHAHQLGVVHRDIKPGNLLVDNQGRLWVADFGLAKWVYAEELTLTGVPLGTLRYMSPEQAQAKHDLVDHRTDVYALGATLYELLTLEPAIRGNDPRGLLRNLVEEEPPAPRRLRREIPAGLEVIVRQAMAKDPDRRYASARELADDLRRFLNGQPIRARRESSYRLLRRWVRHHRTAAALIAVSVVAPLVILVGTLIYASNLREALDRAERETDNARRQEGRAERNAVLRLRALDEVIQTLAGPRLRRAGQVELMRAMLEDLVPLFEEVLTLEDQDDATREQQGVAWNGLGAIRQAQGNTAGCLDAAGKAEAVYRALAEKPTRRDAARLGLGTALHLKGTVLGHQGKYKEAAATLEEGAGLLRDAARDEKALKVRFRLALVEGNWGNCLMRDTRFPALSGAEPHYRTALDLFAALARDRPGEMLYRDWHARSLSNLGLHRGNLRDLPEAKKLTAEAVAVARRMVADFPDGIDGRECLAVCLSNEGTILNALKDAAAGRCFREALTLYEGLERQVPTSLEFRWSCAMAESNLGEVLAAGGPEERAQARKYFDRAAGRYQELLAAHPDNKELRLYADENGRRRRALEKK
jgi:serine/threonine protein kinase